MKKGPHITDLLRRMPSDPGVYQHLDADGKILYVGKAKDLKKRVSSYFTPQAQQHFKTRLLVARIADVKWMVTPTENDALLLENSLIKEHKPFYNIQLKDDKTYPYVVIRKEPFPRVFPTRRYQKDGGEYFGPFTSGRSMHAVLELCRKLYPIRTCNLVLSDENITSGKFRVCLEYHVGNCLAPCVGKQSAPAYDENIQAIRHILRGNMQEALRVLEGQMRDHAAHFRFEEAAQLKARVEDLRQFQTRNTIVHPTIDDVEVFTIASDARASYVNFLRVHRGSIVHGYTSEIRKRLDETDREVLEAAIPLIRDRFGSDARTIFTPFPIEAVVPGVQFVVPQRGDKRRLIELSEKNAQSTRLDRQKQLEQTDPEQATARLLETARLDLRLSAPPVHIECFDNSNIHGTHPASACVVFRNGKPAKDDYRKFNIQTVTGPDDFASMREVVLRRYTRLLEEGESLPQLIIIDGGKGQLSHALEALEELGIRGQVAIIGIAKKLEEIYFPGDSIPIYLDKRSSTLRLIQQLRNEAHRFSLAHHRQRRSKAALRSALDDVPGVGPATRRKLLQHFKTVQAIRAASDEALAQVVSAKVVASLRAFFDAPPSPTAENGPPAQD
jgi:excinuclease ABC subunit C